MTRFRATETKETPGHLAALAEAAVRATGDLGARIGGAIERGEDVHELLAHAGGSIGTSLSHEMVELALANAGEAAAGARANKLAFQLLSTIPTSPVAQLLARVAERAFRRAGPALGAFIDADDLLSLLRWKLWTLAAEYFVPTRILKHPGLTAYLSVIARRIVIDECRTLDSRGRAGIEPETIEASADPRATLDAVLDDLDLLKRLASELPEWQAPIIDVLAGQADRDEALRTINRRRDAAGLTPWSAESMRTAVHRARKRLRELLIKAPSRAAVERPTPEQQLGGVPSAPTLHAWRRFWCGRDRPYSLGDNGFLFDPETEYGRHFHDIVALERLTDVPCLVLLGEPGIGKSTAIRQELHRLASERQHAVLVDLSRTSTAGALRTALERSGVANASPFYLFFDALDEGLARNPSLASDLLAEIEKLDLTRTRVRIACRALEWPTDLEASLSQRWPAEQLRVLELLPLRRIDVTAAANDHGADGAEFVREVHERDVTALAIRPISLRFLLAMYAADGELPHSKSRLFDEGTLILCSEEGAFQRGRGRRNPDMYRRRAIAARLAAASTFTNRHSIVRGRSECEGALPASIAAGGIERLPEATYAVDLSAVEDVLAGTALFTAQTATTYGWSHQSYREFLAAWYLAQHRIAESAERLYFPEGLTHVPGPLREVAAWHATFAPTLFDLLVERDPEVLLHSDGTGISPEARAQLVRALLDRMARYEALDSNYQRRDYQKLAHPQLGEQLRGYITDRQANIIVRRAAMDIAWACDVNDVLDELLAVLVDRNEDLQARETAARALAELGGDRVRDTFVALLASGFAPDPNDSIRGSVLSFLWPDHIGAEGLFRNLAVPQRDDYYGSYQRFIDELPASLRPDDLPLALAWVEALADPADHHLQQAQHDMINVALRHVEQDDVRAVLVRIIRAALNRHRGAWYSLGSYLERDERVLAPSARRLIARDLIRLAHDPERLGSELVHFDPPLIDLDDVRWISELAATEIDENIQRSCGRCIAAIYGGYDYPRDPLAVDAVASVESSAFREPLREFLDPVALGSARARELAERWTYVHRPPTNEPRDEPPAPSRWSLAAPSLERAEAGDLAAWDEFVYHWTGRLPKPITDVAEWETIAPHERERITIAALRYLQAFNAPDTAWLDDANGFPWTAVAARAALQMLAATRPALLDKISETAWRSWCPVLVGITFPSITEPLRSELIRRCAKFEELADAIVRTARRDNRAGGYASVLAELPEPLPEPLQAPLLALIPELVDAAFEDALGALIRAGNVKAYEIASAALRDAAPARAARAARVILPTDATQWSVAIARMRHEREFIDAFAPLVSFREDLRGNPFATLGEQQAAELYLTLLQHYPPDEHARGSRGKLELPDHIERLGRQVINTLVNAGTDAAIRALGWLTEQQPNRETLRYLLVQARQHHADALWQPLSIHTVWSALAPDEAPHLQQTGHITTRGSVVSPQADHEVASEELPTTVLPSPARRDAGRGEISALLGVVHVLIETATNIETAAVHAAMRPLPGDSALVVGSLGVATYTIGLLGNYAVAHLQSDMGAEGPNAAQLATSDAIHEINPKLVVLIGIAFGLQPAKQRLGDVLVAQHITGYGPVKLKPDAIEERGETLRADPTLIERIHAHGRTWRFSRADSSLVAFHVGQLLSGAKLVNNREFRDELVRRFPIALGGEMEGIGAYAAAFRARVPVLLVKAICDWADGTKNDRAQPLAAAAAVDLVRHVFDKPDALAALGVPEHPRGGGTSDL